MLREASSDEVLRVPTDLHNYRDRIEAGLELGKKNRETVQDLTDQVLRIRKKAAEEASVASPVPQISTSSSLLLNNKYPLREGSLYSIESSNRGKTRHKSLGRLDRNDQNSNWNNSDYVPMHHRSTPRLNSSSEDEYEQVDNLYLKLKAELFKNTTLEEMNEMLREENDAALQANEGLRSDVHSLTKALESLESQHHQDQIRFQSENKRYRTHLDNQHRQLIGLWKAFTAVKRQMHDLQISTTNDIDKQRTEFARCASAMHRAIRQVEMKSKMKEEHERVEKEEQLEEVIKKYEDVYVHLSKIEKELQEKNAMLSKRETELKRIREENEEILNVVEKIERIPELSSSTNRKRTRSASPGSPESSDLVRKIRSSLTAKTRQLRELQNELEKSEHERRKLLKEMENRDREQREKREIDRNLMERNQDREIKIKNLDADVNRLTDRIRAMEDERESREKVLQNMQENMAEIHRSHKQYIEDMTARHREELEIREQMFNTDMEGKVYEMDTKFQKLTQENERVKTDCDELRQQLRESRAELTTVKKTLDEKEFSILSLEEDLTALKGKLDDEKYKTDQKEVEIVELNDCIETLKAKEIEIRKEFVELQNTNDILNGEAKNTNDQLLSLRTEMAELMEKLENSGEKEEELMKQLEVNENNSAEMHHIIKNLKTTIHDLELKLESTIDDSRIAKEDSENNRILLKEKIKELTETVKILEDVKREKEILVDDTASFKHDTDNYQNRISQLEKDLQKKNENEEEYKRVMEDLRSNLDKVNDELEQKQITIEDLQAQLDAESAKMTKTVEVHKSELLRLEESHKVKNLEQDQVVKNNSDSLQKEIKKLEKEKKAAEERLADLTKLHEKLMEDELELRMKAEELTESLEQTQTKYKKEVEALTEQISHDREAWEEELQELEKSKQNALNILKEDLNKAEHEIKEGSLREDELRQSINDLNEELEELKSKTSNAYKNLDDKEKDLQDKEKDMNDQNQRLKIEIEELNLKITKITSVYEESQRKIASQEKEIAKSEAAMTRKSAALAEFEQKVDDLLAKMVEHEKQENNLKDKFAVLERENSELKSSRERIQKRLNDDQHRIDELELQLREANKGMQNVKVKTQLSEGLKIERDNKLQMLTNKNKQLELMLADRQAKTDSNSELLKKMEIETTNIGQELRNEKSRNLQIIKENDELKRAIHDISEELETVRSTFEKKVASCKDANNNLLANYREAEKRFVDMQTECERLKGQIETLSIKLERSEMRKRELEKRGDDVDTRNSELVRRLNQYERSARLALNLSRSQLNLRPGISSSDIPKESHSIIRGATSSADLSMRGSPDKSVHFNDDFGTQLDISSSMDITLRYLKERIIQLERDKHSLSSDLDEKLNEIKNYRKKLEESTILLRDMEKKMISLEDENRSIENRLDSQRQLYLSNEETNRSREAEYRSLKAKITASELHLREKDSKINQLNAQIEALRLEFSAMNADKVKLTTTLKHYENELTHIDDDKNNIEADKNRLQRMAKDLQEDLNIMTKRFHDADEEKKKFEKALNELKRASQRDKETLEKLQSEERHWRLTAVNVKKSSDDYHKQKYDERLSALQHNHDAAIARYEAATSESERLKQELREYNQRINVLNQKLSEVELRANTERESRQTICQQLAGFQRVELEWNKLEKEMREELKNLRRDKLQLTSDLEEQKRKMTKIDVERKELDTIRLRLEREIAALKKHLAALEEDRNRMDAAVRDTMSERKAIDKSLAAMERENSELYKNCSQLQSQIQQLERDSGQRAVTRLMKEQTTMEARINKLSQDKKQLELILEQKENAFMHKRKMLESQLALLREQLEAERRRRNSGRFERGADSRLSRPSTTQPQRSASKSPFRINYEYCDVMYYYRSVTPPHSDNHTDTTTSIETVIM